MSTLTHVLRTTTTVQNSQNRQLSAFVSKEAENSIALSLTNPAWRNFTSLYRTVLGKKPQKFRESPKAVRFVNLLSR